MKRVWADIALFVLIVCFFAIHQYTHIPPPLQLLSLKAMLVSAGILHAHIARKLLFPKVNWDNIKLTGGLYVAIVFYIVIIYAYAMGG